MGTQGDQNIELTVLTRLNARAVLLQNIPYPVVGDLTCKDAVLPM